MDKCADAVFIDDILCACIREMRVYLCKYGNAILNIKIQN